MLTKCQTIITFITNSSDKLPWLPNSDEIMPQGELAGEARMKMTSLHPVFFTSFLYRSLAKKSFLGTKLVTQNSYQNSQKCLHTRTNGLQ
jgi:hypothetical protein